MGYNIASLSPVRKCAVPRKPKPNLTSEKGIIMVFPNQLIGKRSGKVIIPFFRSKINCSFVGSIAITVGYKHAKKAMIYKHVSNMLTLFDSPVSKIKMK